MRLGVLIFGALLRNVYANKTCYFPGNIVANGYVPCSDGDDAFCCLEAAICMTNGTTGLCMNMDNPYGLARPACTLGDWTQSSVCHDYCSEVDEALTTGCTLVLIHNEKNIAEYCPNSIIDNWEGNTGCADNATRFTLGPFYSIPNTGYLSNASFSGDSAADNANSITGNSTLATSSDPADHCAGQSTLAAVGAGVGVPLGLICLVSVGYAYYVKRKRFNQEMMRPLPQIQEPPLAYDKPVATVVEPQELPVIVGRELDSTPTSRNHL